MTPSGLNRMSSGRFGRIFVLNLMTIYTTPVLLDGDPLVKMNSGRDKIDMVLNILWDTVFLTRNVSLAGFRMHVPIVLRLQKLFSFMDSKVNMQPVKTSRLLDTFR
jgi:hypothetical protein